MPDFSNDTIIAMAYVEYSTYAGLYIGHTEKRSDGTFNIDIITAEGLFETFHIHKAYYLKEGYLVMELAKRDKNQTGTIYASNTEVFDIVTRKKINR